jgi:hypothetical protein
MWAAERSVLNRHLDLSGVIDRTLANWPRGISSIDISNSNLRKIPPVPHGVVEFSCDYTLLQTPPKLPESVRIVSFESCLFDTIKLPKRVEVINLKNCTFLNSFAHTRDLHYLDISGTALSNLELPDSVATLIANDCNLTWDWIPLYCEHFSAKNSGPVYFETLPMNLKTLKIESVNPAIMARWVFPRCFRTLEIGGRAHALQEVFEPLE